MFSLFFIDRPIFATVLSIVIVIVGTVALTQLPVGTENDFRGVVDLLAMKSHVWEDGMGDRYETVDIPEELKADAEHWRHELVDVVSHHDDTVLEKYVGDEEITADDLKRGLRAATIAGAVVPVLCGSAFKNKAVQPLLDAIIDYLPSPLEVPPVTGHDPKTEDVMERHPDDSEPFSALAFKIMSDPYVGKLTYFRVYSGKLAAGGQVMNVTKNRRERVGRLLQMHANHREDKQAVFAGDIVAAVGLKHTTTGDTLSDPSHAVLLERMWPSSPRRRPTRTSSARPSARSRRRTPPSRSAPTTTPAKRSSRAWASCTSRSSSTG